MTDGRPLIVVTGRHRPHELFLFALQVVLGIAYLVSVPAPQSLAALVAPWLVMVWAGGLLLSGVAGLLAAVWRWRPAAGLEVERAALIVSAGALVLIGGSSFVVNGWRAVFGGGLIVAWALANLARCVQIRREVNQMAGGRR